MSERYDIDDIADRLRRRVLGEWDALEGVWSEGDTISKHNYQDEEIHCTGSQREVRQRAELEAFRAAMGEIKRESRFHVSHETNTIFEVSNWTGTFDGETLSVPSVVVYTVVDGRLFRLDHYGDSVQSDKMTEALFAGGWVKDDARWTSASA